MREQKNSRKRHDCRLKFTTRLTNGTRRAFYSFTFLFTNIIQECLYLSRYNCDVAQECGAHKSSSLATEKMPIRCAPIYLLNSCFAERFISRSTATNFYTCILNVEHQRVQIYLSNLWGAIHLVLNTNRWRRPTFFSTSLALSFDRPQ